MLASIQVLRMNAQEESGRDGAETPLPALEPLEQNDGPLGDIAFDMPSPQFRPYDWRGNVDDGYESADSMPDLQSVSNSDDAEERELSDEDNDEDEDARRAMRLGDRTVLTAAHAVERIQSIEQFSGSSGRRDERVEEPVEREGEDGDVAELDTPVSETSTEEPRLEPPFITDGRGRVVWTSPAEEDKTSRPAEEENGEPASRPEANAGSGGLLGWFNALF
jgi:E3 ubiquitin-protein ligase makorin